MNSRALAVLLLCALCAGSVLAACAPGVAGPAAATIDSRASEPRWEDVFRAPPDLLLVVSPRALRRDKVYGQLLRRAIELARERSRVVSETRALDAMEDAEEVIVGFHAGGAGGAEEIVVVIRGAQANVDPANLVDADGHALWVPGPPGPRESVRELVRATSTPADAATDASLFELPGHTWVIASGPARERARAAFANPSSRGSSRGVVPLDDGSLATLRLLGPALVARIQALQPSGGLAALGRELQSLTLELPPGSEASGREVRATLSYSDEDAAAHAEVRAREILETIARRKPERLSWLSQAKVERPRERVVLAAPLPAALVDGLLHAGAAALDLDGQTAQAPPGTTPHP